MIVVLVSGSVAAVAALYALYRVPLTNTTPVGAYRGAGRPDVAYAVVDPRIRLGHSSET